MPCQLRVRATDMRQTHRPSPPPNAGVWETILDGRKETIIMRGDVDRLSLTWEADGAVSRELDWSWGGHDNIFTLSGGDNKKILRWRPSVRHFIFDDDHVVWTAYDTTHRPLVSRDRIVYTRKTRTLKYFKDVDPYDWCSYNY